MKNDLLEQVMINYAAELHGKAASVVDPETGKHVPIFVRRIGEEGWAIHTNGSSSFARALEIRLGLGKGEVRGMNRSEEHTSELQSLMRISYAVFCLKKKTTTK